jgi:hypothetical protein
MKIPAFFLTSITAMVIGLPHAAQAKLAPAVKIDVTEWMPTSVEQAKERCKAMPTILKQKKAESKRFWGTAVACLAVDGGALQGEKGDTNIFIETGKNPKIHGMELQPQKNGSVLLAIKSANAAVGDENSFFTDKKGKKHSYATPIGVFPIQGKYGNLPKSYAKYTKTLFDLGSLLSRPYKNNRSVEVDGILAIHEWTPDEGIFAKKERHVSNGCIRTYAEFMKFLYEYVPATASVYITKTIPPFQSFPAPAMRQNGADLKTDAGIAPADEGLALSPAKENSTAHDDRDGEKLAKELYTIIAARQLSA